MWNAEVGKENSSRLKAQSQNLRIKDYEGLSAI
jgi:hypothetical protein